MYWTVVVVFSRYRWHFNFNYLYIMSKMCDLSTSLASQSRYPAYFDYIYNQNIHVYNQSPLTRTSWPPSSPPMCSPHCTPAALTGNVLKGKTKYCPSFCLLRSASREMIGQNVGENFVMFCSFCTKTKSRVKMIQWVVDTLVPSALY